MKFGMIPEFIGRLPVVCALGQLDESALLDILTQPKNAIVKQFKRLFSFETVDLKFTDGALRAVVQEALKRKTGARGLRAILEVAMLEIMYEMPGVEGLKEVIITEETIVEKAEPVMVYRTEEEKAAAAISAKEQPAQREFGSGGAK